MPEQFIIKYYMYIMALESMSEAHFINPPSQSISTWIPLSLLEFCFQKKENRPKIIWKESVVDYCKFPTFDWSDEAEVMRNLSHSSR
jgi:hypothetical protein